MRPVFQKFQTVVITSGTLSPIDLYPRILNFNPVAILSLAMTLTRCSHGSQLPLARAHRMHIRGLGHTLMSAFMTHAHEDFRPRHTSW